MIGRLMHKTPIVVLAVIYILSFAGQTALATDTNAGITYQIRVTYNLSYDGGGYDSGLPSDESYPAGVDVVAGKPHNRAQYRFSGWKYAGPPTVFKGRGTVSNGTIIEESSTFIMPDGDVSLTALWTRMCTVTFNSNDGRLNSTHAAVFVTQGGSIGNGNIPPKPTRSNYRFIGWSRTDNGRDNETAIIASMIIDEDVTVYALWGLSGGGAGHTTTPVQKPTPTPTPAPAPPPDPVQPPDSTPPSGTTPVSPPDNGQTTVPPLTTEPGYNPDPDPPPDNTTAPVSNPNTTADTQQRPTAPDAEQTEEPELSDENFEDLEVFEDFEGSEDLKETEEVPNDWDVPLIPFGNITIPLFTPKGVRSRALINPILAAIGIIYAAVFMVQALIRKVRIQKEAMENYYNNINESALRTIEDEPDKRFKPGWLAAASSLGILGGILSLLTQDMSNIVVLFDWWTLLHAIIIACETIMVALAKKKKGQIEYRSEMQSMLPV